MSLQKNQNSRLRDYDIYQDFSVNHLTYAELSLKYNLSLDYIRNICNATKKTAVQFENEPEDSLKRSYLPTRIINALLRTGISTVDDLKFVLMTDPDRIERLPHLGSKGFTECKAFVGLLPNNGIKKDDL